LFGDNWEFIAQKEIMAKQQGTEKTGRLPLSNHCPLLGGA